MLFIIFYLFILSICGIYCDAEYIDRIKCIDTDYMDESIMWKEELIISKPKIIIEIICNSNRSEIMYVDNHICIAPTNILLAGVDRISYILYNTLRHINVIKVVPMHNKIKYLVSLHLTEYNYFKNKEYVWLYLKCILLDIRGLTFNYHTYKVIYNK